jgi:TatD DNase family protein
LFWDKTFLKEQQIAFRTQIQWAKKYKLPIVIHAAVILRNLSIRTRKSQMIYLGSFIVLQELMSRLQAISYNMKLGIGGVVTFKMVKVDQF